LTISEYTHLKPLQVVLEDLALQYSNGRGTLVRTDLARLINYRIDLSGPIEVLVMREMHPNKLLTTLGLRPHKDTLVIMEYLSSNDKVKAVVDNELIDHEEFSMLKRSLTVFCSNHKQNIEIERKQGLNHVKYDVEYEIHVGGNLIRTSFK
jgi:hypothetical protein